MGHSEQYDLMMQGKKYSFDKYLYKLQHKCFKRLKIINFLSFKSKIREYFLKKLFGSYGDNNNIKSNFTCNFGFNISIGSNCYINHNVTMLDSYKIVIGNNVFIAPGVVISAVTHPNDYNNRRNLIIKPIVIEDDVWIGANTVILPGVTIHRGAVIGACSLVKKDVTAETVNAGIPTKIIKKSILD